MLEGWPSLGCAERRRGLQRGGVKLRISTSRMRDAGQVAEEKTERGESCEGETGRWMERSRRRLTKGGLRASEPTRRRYTQCRRPSLRRSGCSEWSVIRRLDFSVVDAVDIFVARCDERASASLLTRGNRRGSGRLTTDRKRERESEETRARRREREDERIETDR